MLLRDRFDPRYFDADVLFRYHAGWAGPTFSRASTATYIDRTGTLREVGPDVPRIDWSHGRPALRLEPQQTNQIRNPRCEGAVIGVVGSGGALPTHWSTAGIASLTVEVLGASVEDGIPYALVRVHGVPTSSIARIRFEATTQISAKKDETWTASVYAQLADGALPTGGGIEVGVQERDAGGSVLAQSATVLDTSAPRLSSTYGTHTRQLSEADTAHVTPAISITGLTVGQAVDLTLRIGGPMLDPSPVASSLILPPPGAPAAATRATETVTVPWPHAPQPMTLYVRMVEVGGVRLGVSTPLVRIGAGNPRLLLRLNSTVGRYGIRYVHGDVDVAPTLPSPAPDPGQIVELLLPIGENGAHLEQSIDGGEASQTPEAEVPLPSEWGTPTLTIGGGGQFDLLDVLALRGASWTMDQVRAYLPGW